MRIEILISHIAYWLLINLYVNWVTAIVYVHSSRLRSVSRRLCDVTQQQRQQQVDTRPLPKTTLNEDDVSISDKWQPDEFTCWGQHIHNKPKSIKYVCGKWTFSMPNLLANFLHAFPSSRNVLCTATKDKEHEKMTKKYSTKAGVNEQEKTKRKIMLRPGRFLIALFSWRTFVPFGLSIQFPFVFVVVIVFSSVLSRSVSLYLSVRCSLVVVAPSSSSLVSDSVIYGDQDHRRILSMSTWLFFFYFCRWPNVFEIEKTSLLVSLGMSRIACCLCLCLFMCRMHHHSLDMRNRLVLCACCTSYNTI